jgi:hypothetical protein
MKIKLEIKMANSLSFTILLFAVCASQIQAYDFWDDLRVTWGTSPIEAYHRLPRNTVDAVVDGWQKVSETCENGGRFSGFQWIDPKDDGVALLFDTKGYVAGIQSMVPQSELLVPGSKVDYSKVSMYRNYTLNGRTYFTITAYFIDPTLICHGGLGNGNIGAGSQIYFQNGATDNYLKLGPKNRTQAIAQGWTKNQCIPGMGWHNFFEVEKYDESDCSEVQPTCLLFNEHDELHGFCLTYAGLATSPRFEHPNSAGIEASLGNAPQCLLDQTDLIGATTIHVYFQNNPWFVGC